MKIKSEQLNMCNANTSVSAKEITWLIECILKSYHGHTLHLHSSSILSLAMTITHALFIKNIYGYSTFQKYEWYTVLAMECQHIQATNTEIWTTLYVQSNDFKVGVCQFCNMNSTTAFSIWTLITVHQVRKHSIGDDTQ